jgi:hypothetical protein
LLGPSSPVAFHQPDASSASALLGRGDDGAVPAVARSRLERFLDDVVQ